MNANELRIGNWVEFKSTHVMVDMISVERIGHCDNDFTEAVYSPIPLTPEILEKAGFKYDTDMEAYLHEDDTAGIHIVEKDGLFSVEFYYSYLQLQYLHQLQNLYFVLTGKELEIKL